jgi:plasmid stability protein
MTLTIELDPETDARLKVQAVRLGISPEQCAREFLRNNLPLATGASVLKQQDLEELTRELTRGSENLPILPPEVNRRESYYEDRW